MNGPEHYREAERRLLMAWEEDRRPEDVWHLVAEAQVHATLARVAAYALAQPISDSESTAGHPSQEHYEDWVNAVEFGDTAVETGMSAELAGVRERLGALHRPVDGGPDHDGSCIVDGEDFPCSTLRALDGTDSGSCDRCGEPPESWCPKCAGCACPNGRAEAHAPGGSCPTAPPPRVDEPTCPHMTVVNGRAGFCSGAAGHDGECVPEAGDAR